jgi:hypothetical protein
VEGASAAAPISLLHAKPHATGARTTTLRVVPLPRFTGEDEGGDDPVYAHGLYPS